MINDITPWTVACQALLSMKFSRLEYGMGSHSLLHGIFLTQGWNPSLPHCGQILYCLSHQGSPSKWYYMTLIYSTWLGFPDDASSRKPICQCRRQKRHFDPCVGKIPWKRIWHPTPICLPGEPHGQRRGCWTTVPSITKSQTRLQRLKHVHTLV